MSDRLRVLVADDHPLFREGVVHSLSLEEDIDVVAEAASGSEAVSLASELLPDVVVMDLGMPEVRHRSHPPHRGINASYGRPDPHRFRRPG